MIVNKREDSESGAALHRQAYNAAFNELGLRWHWDERLYEKLARIDDVGERLRRYLALCRPHMLPAYDSNFLAAAIEETKARCLASRIPTTPAFYSSQ